jgi:hypothetical protein
MFVFHTLAVLKYKIDIIVLYNIDYWCFCSGIHHRQFKVHFWIFHIFANYKQFISQNYTIVQCAKWSAHQWIENAAQYIILHFMVVWLGWICVCLNIAFYYIHYLWTTCFHDLVSCLLKRTAAHSGSSVEWISRFRTKHALAALCPWWLPAYYVIILHNTTMLQ